MEFEYNKRYNKFLLKPLLSPEMVIPASSLTRQKPTFWSPNFAIICVWTSNVHKFPSASTEELYCHFEIPYEVHFKFDVHVTVHRDEFLKIKPTRCTRFLKFILGMKLYMFWTVPLSPTRSFSLYTQQWYMSYWFADSLQAESGCSILILPTSCQQTCMTYTTAVCTVKNSWWWVEELSETCRVSFQE